MAIQLNTTTESAIPVSYFRVVTVTLIKGVQNLIEVAGYINEGQRRVEEAAIANGESMSVYIDTRYVSAPYDPNMTLTDAYDYIKQLPEYAGCTNLLTADNDPNAWASAVAGGEIEAADVPEEIIDEVAQVTVAAEPADKIGFVSKRRLVPTAWSVVWEFEPDPNYKPDEPDGSYLKPYPYEVGMEVTQGFWYTDSEDIWEAIASGTPESFADQNYFDII